ncbi:Tracheary Element Differentiation-related 4 [Hibiscus trionum]|uniref:Tracheary Element Differentiation-related 4 n=1 Tax=Hibiscus trionum TaxID=183268 RepID=A0A9W7HCS6_HIBTR|nr:Tracheary Element Differentiation-related 4 [Hibiscus trionum]
MKRVSFVVLFVAALAVSLFSGETCTAEAAICDPQQLSPCISALTSRAAPSTACCGRLNEQRPCLCGYIRNPTLKQFVGNPNTRRIASTCRVPYPRC